MKTRKKMKSIYEEAVETLNKYRNQNYNSTNKDEVELANAINVILPNYVKQEKLLELYKEYFEYSEMLKDGRKFGGRMLVEHERDKIIEEIKELEKEKED